ncbi:MAG: discoidin domain-containing protein [Saprospiraceae bacterium]|nr:discoidin domain-containing protein [Saprospiraceae bacterium]
MKNIILIIVVLLLPLSIWAQCFEADASIWNNPWVSCSKSRNPISGYGNTHWIQYDLGQVRRLSKTWIWNTNDPSKLSQGFRSVKIDYSSDGYQWQSWGEMIFPQGTGEAVYSGFPGPDMVGVKARYVVFTALDNYGNPSCAGLTEVKFNLLPNAQGTTDDGLYEYCEPVVDVETEDIDETTVELLWDAVNPYEDYLVEYRLVGTTDWKSDFGDYDHLIIENLIPFETYEYRVSTICLTELAPAVTGQFSLGDVTTSTSELVEREVHIFPNPTRGPVGIDLSSSHQERLHYNLVSPMSQVLKAGYIDHLGGTERLRLDLGDLPNGVYYLQLHSGNQNEVLSKRIVKISN